MSQVFWVESKQPSEVKPISVDWTAAFDAGETFSTGGVSLTNIIDRESGADVTGSMYIIGSLGTSSNVLFFRAQGGSDNRDYVAQVRVISSKSRIEDGKIIIPVRARVR